VDPRALTHFTRLSVRVSPLFALVRVRVLPRTLKVMLIIALSGMPVVLGYTVWVYRLFGGKVRAGDELHY